MILLRWKWMGIKLVIALTPYKGDVWKTSIIHRATLLCIFFSSLKGWYNGIPLKYQSWKPYKTIEKTHILYKRCLCIRESWKDSFLSKKKPRYHHISLNLSKGPLKNVNSKRGRLMIFVDLKKWKTFNLLCSITRPNWLKRDKIML